MNKEILTRIKLAAWVITLKCPFTVGNTASVKDVNGMV